MILSIPIQDFNKECIYFGDYIKNIVIQNSFFIRLFYSTEHLSINVIYITFPMCPVHIRYFIQTIYISFYISTNFLCYFISL